MSSASPSRWLFGPAADLLLGAGLAYAIVFLLLALAGPTMRSIAPVGLLPLVAMLTGTPHYGATLLRVYERREDRRAYAIFAVYATLVVWTVFAVGVYNVAVGSLFLTLYLTWSPWHYSGQNYGIALMFLGRRGVSVPAQAKKLLYLSFLLSFALTFLAVHGAAANASYAPVPFDGVAYQFLPIGIPVFIVGPLGLLCLVAYAFTVIGAFVLLRREAAWSDLGPAAVLVGTQALWFVVPVVCRAAGVLQGIEPLSTHYAGYAFLWIAFAHATQYLWVTTYYARRTSHFPGKARYYGRTLLAGSAIWGIPALLFAPGVLGTHSFDAGLLVLIASAVNLHHFILDGAVWKLRDGRIARILLRSEDRSEGAPVQPRRSWFRPLAFAAGAVYVVVVVVGTLEVEIGAPGALERSDLGRLETSSTLLRWIGRDHADVHLALGEVARQKGDASRALRAFQESHALRPSPIAWIGIAGVHHAKKEWEAASGAYEKALALDPANVDALHRLGIVRLASGDAAAARTLLARAAALAPGRKDVRRALRRAQRAVLDAEPSNPRGS